MWSVLAKLHPVEKDPQRVTKYAQYTKELDFSNIEFPVKIKDIPRFEKQNNLTVNVYSYDDEKKGSLSSSCFYKFTNERPVSR